MSFPAQTIFLLIYQSPATARYALEMSPSKCCSSMGLFPWTLCLLYVVALFAPLLSLWWCFPPPLYDFDGAFCHHFLSSDFIVILFRFQISKNGGRKMEPFLNSGGRFSPPNSESGGTFCPHSGYVAKLLFRFIIHTNWNFQISLCK